MSGILRLESLTKGNTLKQGDKTPLKYKLLDADGDLLSIAGKSAEVRLVYPDFLTIGYKKDGLTVAQDDTVTFTIDQAIPARIYHVEIIVDNKFVFPSRAHGSKLTIDKSSLGADVNIIEIVGKDVLIQEVKSQVDTELQPLVTSLESAQQAEIQRASDESVRASAEAQRKIDHANRSAELAGKADKVVLENLVANGDFSDDTNGFTVRDGELTVAEGVAAFTPSVSNSRFFATVSLNYGDTLYVFTKIKSNLTNIRLGDVLNGYATYTDIGNWEFLSYTNVFDFTVRYPSVISFENNPEGFVEVQYMGVLNLTQTFGTGNEPTKKEMDELIKVTGYIDGEYAINNKEILIWTLGLIRRNKNAIVTLGGA